MSTNTVTQGFLPYDQNSNLIQVLQPDDTNVTSLTASGTTNSSAISGLSTTRLNVVEVASASDIHMVFGGAGVTATTSSRYFPKGVAVYQLDTTQTHIAVIQASGSSGGPVTVTPMV